MISKHAEKSQWESKSSTFHLYLWKYFFFTSYVATVFMLLINTGKKICMKGKLMEGHFKEQV